MIQEVTLLEPGGGSRQVPLDRERIRIGRSSDNDLSFPADMSLSRHHLVLEQVVQCLRVALVLSVVV